MKAEIANVQPKLDFGYDISDYEGIQPEYGTMEDFEELIAKAKQLGKANANEFAS